MHSTVISAGAIRYGGVVPKTVFVKMPVMLSPAPSVWAKLKGPRSLNSLPFLSIFEDSFLS